MPLRTLLPIVFALGGLALSAAAGQEPAPIELVISVPEQKMLVVREGAWVKKYPISTSRFGLGDHHGSYKTPLGRLRVCEKLGDDLVAGAVLKHREPTGEVLPVNAPGRDPIVSRIIWLEGLEAQNDNARPRGIYIHGTPEEVRIGKPVSWGCIRMRSRDIIELYEGIQVGASVLITTEDLPRLSRWKPAPVQPPLILAGVGPLPLRQLPSAPKLAALSSKSLPDRTRLESRLVWSPKRPEVESATESELLEPEDQEAVQNHAGTASAFRGSILFAGLPDAPHANGRSSAKKSRKTPIAAPAVASVPLVPPVYPGSAVVPLEMGVFAELEGFAITSLGAAAPLQLIDLRRTTVQAEGEGASILTAPVPGELATHPAPWSDAPVSAAVAPLGAAN